MPAKTIVKYTENPDHTVKAELVGTNKTITSSDSKTAIKKALELFGSHEHARDCQCRYCLEAPLNCRVSTSKNIKVSTTEQGYIDVRVNRKIILDKKE